jgi:hypothetical protein
MIDVAEAFVHVRNEAGAPREEHLRSRVIDLLLPAGPFRVALDSEWHKHALFPLDQVEADLDDRTAGVHLRTRELVLGRKAMRFADLECIEPALDLVFEHLVTDILERLSADASAPARTCAVALEDWRDLLRNRTDEVAHEVALGLVGELEALRLLGTSSPSRALECWVGPLRRSHDFVSGGRRLEVKSTASVDGQSIQVSNIDQLDPDTAPGGLHLLVLHCAQDEAASTLDDRIRDLISTGFPRSGLIRAVGAAGYVFESGQAAPAFSIRSARLWPVGQDFPGLRSRDIPDRHRPAVSRVRYELSLAAAPAPMGLHQMGEVLAAWCDA